MTENYGRFIDIGRDITNIFGLFTMAGVLFFKVFDPYIKRLVDRVSPPEITELEEPSQLSVLVKYLYDSRYDFLGRMVRYVSIGSILFNLSSFTLNGILGFEYSIAEFFFSYIYSTIDTYSADIIKFIVTSLLRYARRRIEDIFDVVYNRITNEGAREGLRLAIEFLRDNYD